MTIAVTEKKLEAAAQARLGDEKVLCAGLFQPYGSGIAGDEGMGGAMELVGAVSNNPLVDAAAGLLGGYGAQKGLSAYEKEPMWTALAVTEHHIHAFDASAIGGEVATDKLGEEYATWDRATVEVHTKKWVTSFNLFIADHDSGVAYAYKGNKIYKVGGKLVAHLLTES